MTSAGRCEAYAHRGLALDCPENTLEAFARAQACGVRWIETDVNTTRDGVVLIFHDPTLNRVAGVPGIIAEMDYEEIRQVTLPGGHSIPTLEQALRRFPELNFNVDIKDAASAAHLPQVLADTGAADRVRIASFSTSRSAATLRGLRSLLPEKSVRSSASALEVAVFYFSHWVPGAWRITRRLVRPFDSLQIPRRWRWGGLQFELVTPRLVRAAQRAGMKLMVWTVDDPEEMRELLSLGVDGLVSNRVDLLQKILEES